MMTTVERGPTTVDGQGGADPGAVDRVVTVELGRVDNGPADGDGQGGRVAYLPARQVIVVVGERDGAVWRAVVVAGLGPLRDGGRTTVDPVELAAGHGTISVSARRDPNLFVVVWLWRVWRHWAGGRTVALAWDLVHLARIPGTVTIALTPTAATRVRHGAHLSRFGLRRLLTRLSTAGLVIPVADVDPVDGDVYTLCVPPDGWDVFGNPPAGVR